MAFPEEKGNTLAQNNEEQGNPFKQSPVDPTASCQIEVKDQKSPANAFSLFSVGKASFELRQEGLLFSLVKKNKEGKLTLPDPALFEEFLELSADPNKTKYASRMIYLERKPNKSAEEVRELMLYNTEHAAHAKRIAALEHKEDRTKEEAMELKFLFSPLKDRAARMAYLYCKENRTEADALEIIWYSKKDLRPYADKYLPMIMNPDLDAYGKRELSYFNIATADIAGDIAKLEVTEERMAEFKDFIEFVDEEEKRDAKKARVSPPPMSKRDQYVLSLDNISVKGQEKLAKLYLKYICNIRFHTKEQLFQNYRSVAFNPVGNCVNRDRFFDMNASREFATLRAVEDYFDQAASQITAAILRQDKALQQKLKQSLESLPWYQREESEQNVMAAMVKNCKQKNIIMLALLSHYFDLALCEDPDDNHHLNIGYRLAEQTKILVKQIEQEELDINTYTTGTAKCHILYALALEYLREMEELANQPANKESNIISHLNYERQHPYTTFRKSMG